MSAIIQIDLEATGDWATRRELPYTSFEDLTTKPAVEELIKAEVNAANERLVRVEHVRAFRLLPKELHQDDGEMTATQKVRRSAVSDKFNDLIESIWGRRMNDVMQYLVSGVAVQVIYALVALGFVAIYRASKVFNFAHGEFLTFGALMMALLYTPPAPPNAADQLGGAVLSGFGLSWGSRCC